MVSLYLHKNRFIDKLTEVQIERFRIHYRLAEESDIIKYEVADILCFSATLYIYITMECRFIAFHADISEDDILQSSGCIIFIL